LKKHSKVIKVSELTFISSLVIGLYESIDTMFFWI